MAFSDFLGSSGLIGVGVEEREEWRGRGGISGGACSFKPNLQFKSQKGPAVPLSRGEQHWRTTRMQSHETGVACCGGRGDGGCDGNNEGAASFGVCVADNCGGCAVWSCVRRGRCRAPRNCPPVPVTRGTRWSSSRYLLDITPTRSTSQREHREAVLPLCCLVTYFARDSPFAQIRIRHPLALPPAPRDLHHAQSHRQPATQVGYEELL